MRIAATAPADVYLELGVYRRMDAATCFKQARYRGHGSVEFVQPKISV
jgi:hypothetical protein